MTGEEKKELRVSDERFRVLADSMPHIVWYADASGVIGYINQWTFAYVGIQPDDINGWDWASVIYPDDLDATVTAGRRALETGGTYEIEQRLRRTDGEYRWHLTRGVAVRDGHGRVVQWIGTATDIHDQKQTMEALQESQILLRAVLDGTSDPVYVKDRESRIILGNPALAKAAGKPLEEILGKTDGEYYGDSAVGRVLREHDLRVMESGRGEVTEETVPTPTGPRTFLSSKAPYRNASGEVMGILGISSDITERKQTEEALAHSNRKIAEILESIQDGFFALDRDWRFAYLNRRAANNVGFAPEDLIGKSLWENFPELLGTDSEAAYRRVMEEREIQRFEMHGVRTNRTYDIAVYPSVEGISVYWQDITERKRAEKALRASEDRYRALAEELREADRHKNEFMAILSHELRNPLAAIQNGLHILDRAVPGGEQAGRAKDVIDRQAAQLTHLVDDLLDVTRITQNKIKLQRERIELNGLVRRALDDHRPIFEQHEVRLEAVLSPDPLFVNADGARLVQVIGNLLQNAVKFTHRDGRVTVSVAADPGGRVLIRVADTGVGIPPEMLPRLFQPFMQADTTLDRGRGGLGLGLALSKGLVELHGGEISVHSAGINKGSEFTVCLPLDDTSVAEARDSREQVPHRSRRVLIIEDHVDLAESLRELLEFDGHEVAVAYSGAEGLARACEFLPEVLLCDIGLPGMDGYAVARAFRADEVLGEVYLVALTGYALPEDLQRAAEAGFDRHLAKPPDLAALERMLVEVPGGGTAG